MTPTTPHNNEALEALNALKKIYPVTSEFLVIEEALTRANQRASEEVEVRQMWDELDHFWRWIERAYFDKTLGVDMCLNVLVHSPVAPWNVDREAWDTRHKSYDADIDKVVAETKARAREVSPATVQGGEGLRKLHEDALRTIYKFGGHKNPTASLNAQAEARKAFETALTHPREQQREDEREVYGLDEAIDNLKDAKGSYCYLNERDIRHLHIVLEAARRYARQSSALKEKEPFKCPEGEGTCEPPTQSVDVNAVVDIEKLRLCNRPLYDDLVSRGIIQGGKG